MSMINELFHVSLYKRNQGRVARQVTFAVIALVVGLGGWRLSEFFVGREAWIRFAVPGLLVAAGWWIAYRLVNMPNFADFLISVEGEMAKVSWPARTELFRSSLVVIITIIVLATILFGYDLLWRELLRLLRVV